MIYTESLKASRQTAKVVPPSEETFHLLGSGLVIFKERKPRYCRRHGDSHAYPVLSFRKSVRTCQTVLSPFSRCSPCGLTGVSSAALSTSSSTDFSGRMHLMSTAPTKRCTIALSGGAGSVFSIKFSLSWQIKHLLMLPDDRLIPSQGSPHGGKPAQKGVLHVSSVEQKEA